MDTIPEVVVYFFKIRNEGRREEAAHVCIPAEGGRAALRRI